VREQTLITVTLDEIKARLPFSMLGLDVDNDSAFINEVLLSYCRQQKLELTRSRAYKKNDQAWIEQKNGAIVRKLVGHGRLEGAEATLVLADLHKVARLGCCSENTVLRTKSLLAGLQGRARATGGCG